MVGFTGVRIADFVGEEANEPLGRLWSLLCHKGGHQARTHIGLWQEGGVDFPKVFSSLHGIGYRGFATVHQAFAGVMPVDQAVGKSYRYLEPLIGSPDD